MVISINALDHIALRVIDVEQSLKFYCDVLGLVSERVSAWRDGQAPFPSVRINRDTLIDLLDGKPNGVNQDHFCLVIRPTDLDELKAKCESLGIRIQAGPGSRWGAKGNGTSLYLYDPDSNVVELRYY